jgi:hypothetical protein
LPAEKCLESVDKRLNKFKIDIKTDIVSMTTDGASIMKKVGKVDPCSQQLCFLKWNTISNNRRIISKKYPGRYGK